MSPEEGSSTDTTPDAGSDLSAELEEMVGSGAPGGLPEPAGASTNETPPLPAPITPSEPTTALEEFEIDGRRIGKEALFQTYRQFVHLQKLHQDHKPFLDLSQRLGLRAEEVPQFEVWLSHVLSERSAPAASPSAVPQGTSAASLEQQGWFQEVGETFPKFAAMLREEVTAREAAVEEIRQMKEMLTGYTTALQDRQRHEQAFTVLSKASDILTGLMKNYEPLQQEDHRRAFLTWLWNEQRPGPKIADPDFVEGMYLRFNRDALAQLAAAKAKESQQAHAATVARGFAETGAPRPALSGSEDALTKELQEMLST